MKIHMIAIEFIKRILHIASRTLTNAIKVKSIRSKLILAFLVPVIFIVILGIYSYSNTGVVTDSVKQSFVSAVKSTGSYMDVTMTTLDNLVFQINSDVDLQDYLGGNILKYDPNDALAIAQLKDTVTKKLLTLSQTDENISALYLIGKDDKSISTQSRPTSGIFEDMQKTEFFKTLDALKGKSLFVGKHEEIDKLISTDSSRYSVSIIKMIRSMDAGVNMGVLIIDLKPEFAEKIMGNINIEKGEEIHIISPDNRDINNSSDNSNSSVIGQSFFEDIVAGETESDLLSANYDGSAVTAAYTKIGETGYILLGLVSNSSLNSSATRILVGTLIFVILAIVIACTIGIFMANSMSRTINRIISASGSAASGDLTVTPVSKRTDELGTLTRSVNSMISSMKSLIEQMKSTSLKVSSSAGTVSNTSRQVSSVSEEISRTIQEISQGASSQASDAESCVEKIDLLAVNINNVTQSAKLITNLTKDAMDMTQQGLGSVDVLSGRANETTEISREILSDIQKLDTHSKSIGKIVKVINTIVDQTNLLALNATIEAARAGKMGKGFAVVADEVRKLADKSLNATKEISNIINETREQMSKTVTKAELTENILQSQNEAVQNTIQTLSKIGISMEALTGEVVQIMTRVEEMESNKDQVIYSIQNISTVSQQTAASSEEVTAATEEQLSGIMELSTYASELDDESKKLEKAISRFKLD